jgi:hypothetical protein
MRFGSHTHADPEQMGAKLKKDEPARLVATLRRLADRLEGAPVERVSEALAWMAAAVEPLVQTVERAFGREK